MRAAGVNRVSLGSQGFDPVELAFWAHPDAWGPGRAMAVARAAGIANVNLDLMYGLPGQDEETWERSLDAALSLEPDHLSAYCLSLEPGTEITRGVESGSIPRPDEDRAASLYEILVSRAVSAGYDHYEISNFARPGRESRHNLRYWTRAAAALGPSSHALVGNHRWANPAPLEAWTRAYAEPGAAPAPREVPLAEARFEWIFLNLRLHRGISTEEYAVRFGEAFLARYGETVERLRNRGLLLLEGDRIRLSDRARFLSDAVFAEFAP
jgi:oxygen-independent coproporphyrinogen-3 oxidase